MQRMMQHVASAFSAMWVWQLPWLDNEAECSWRPWDSIVIQFVWLILAAGARLVFQNAHRGFRRSSREWDAENV